MSLNKLVIVAGPTGAGKSALGLALACDLGGEIINADSLALYKGFDVGTAKPTIEERRQAPHHLIDFLNPDEEFEAAAYLKAARPLVADLNSRGVLALAVGGTGFYLRSLTSGLFEGPGRDDDFRLKLKAEKAAGVDLYGRLKEVDPVTAARLSANDWVRIERALEVYHSSGKSISAWQDEHRLAEKPFEVLSLVIDRPKDELNERMALRTRQMLEGGLIEEVENLLAMGWDRNLKPFGSIGYKETVAYLEGRLTLEETFEAILSATRKLAKRQRTWFRGQMPGALWFHPEDCESINKTVRNFWPPKVQPA